MQRVCETRGDVKKYFQNPKLLVNDDTLACPICLIPHRLRLHGTYERWCILPGHASGAGIRVQRLLCIITGKTISLLPDFCLPRRQYSPAVVGIFLYALVIKSCSLLGAMREVRPGVTSHAVAQSLRDGFAGQQVAIKAYLASLHPCAIKVPAKVSPKHHNLAMMILGLLGKQRKPDKIFLYHARCIHQKHHVSLLATCAKSA